MYNQNRVIIGILTTMLLTELGATIGVLANTLLKFQTEEGGCLVTVTPKLFPYMWQVSLPGVPLPVKLLALADNVLQGSYLSYSKRRSSY